jgi:superfamily I DNA and/or RNA helicase
VAERGLTLEELTQPLFSALVEEAPEANVVTLSRQHRMHPAIGRLVSQCFYDGQLTSAEREPLSWLAMLAPRPVTWLTTAHLDERAERRAKASVVNRTEAQAIVTFLRTADGLARAARKRPMVAVLSGYAAQRDALEERIARERPALQALSVECSTVDAFQGRQADIIIYSLTRSNERRQLGFVKERPRLNVALSRARDALIIVGDHAFARQARDSASLRRVLDHVEDYPDDCCLERARL